MEKEDSEKLREYAGSLIRFMKLEEISLDRIPVRENDVLSEAIREMHLRTIGAYSIALSKLYEEFPEIKPEEQR